jgi:hypothetical protein
MTVVSAVFRFILEFKVGLEANAYVVASASHGVLFQGEAHACLQAAQAGV